MIHKLPYFFLIFEKRKNPKIFEFHEKQLRAAAGSADGLLEG
ncbi:MAG: hypothetical protein ACJAYJ_000684 [Saprospiraceae bacterium]|jgi:hypothetical protein